MELYRVPYPTFLLALEFSCCRVSSSLCVGHSITGEGCGYMAAYPSPLNTAPHFLVSTMGRIVPISVAGLSEWLFTWLWEQYQHLISMCTCHDDDDSTLNHLALLHYHDIDFLSWLTQYLSQIDDSCRKVKSEQIEKNAPENIGFTAYFIHMNQRRHKRVT